MSTSHTTIFPFNSIDTIQLIFTIFVRLEDEGEEDDDDEEDEEEEEEEEGEDDLSSIL